MAVKEVDIQEVPSGTLSTDYATNNNPAIGARHIQAIILFVAIVISYLSEISFLAALFAMDDSSIQWRGVLNAFSKGYMWLPVLAGFLGYKYGTKYFLIFAIGINSIAFILIPFAANTSGSNGVTICRYIQGLSQGFLFPCVHVFLGKWAPPDERSTLAMIIYSGRIVAIIAANLITKLDWSRVFYLYGALGLAWSALYYFFGFNDPASHPNISTEERCYIETSLKQDFPREKNISAPWKHIVMAVLPVLAVMTANFSSTLSGSMTMTEIPMYLYQIMDFDIYSHEILPYLSSAICGAIAACLSDYLIRKNYITRLNSRKLFQAIASYGELICLVLLIYVAKDMTTVLILITISQAFHGASFAGYIVNEIDLTPRFAGILRGISITVSQIIELYYVSLVFVDFLNQPGHAKEWKTLFMGNVILCFVTATWFICCASATKQKWDTLET